MGFGHPSSVLKWTSQVVETLAIKGACDHLGRAALIAWFIWKVRNEFVFDSAYLNPELTMKRALEAIREYTEVVVSSPIHMDNPNIVDNISQWRATDRGRVKVNCDVAVKGDGTDAKVAVTIRDWKGSLINGMVGCSVKISSSLQGELLAIRQGCEMIKDLGMMEGLG